MGNEVDILIDGKIDVINILVCECRQINMHTRHIDTLARSQHTVILHLCNHGRTIDTYYLHAKGTIVK